MSTIDDFENALTGATATHIDGRRAIKMGDIGGTWITTNGLWCSTEQVWGWDFALDPLEPAPATAHEALALAWELAHPVKEGQVISGGTRYLTGYNSEVKEHTAQFDIEITPELVPIVRTLEPLPDPEPDWIDALAVLARHVKAPDSPPALWVNLGSGLWGLAETTKRAEVWELRDVTPLYPKGKKE